MDSQNRQYFDGSTSFTDAHDDIQTKAGNITWLTEFSPCVEGPKERIAESLLWAFHLLGLCCTIAGKFAMYISGRLVSRPDVITIYIACHPQKWSADISVLLQKQRTPAFSLNSLNFLFVPEYSLPGKMLHYVIRYGAEIRALRIVCTGSVISCGPRSNIDLTHYIWSTFEYYCANYAIVLLPSHTSGDKIVYVRRYQAEIGGESSRFCGQCVCITKNRRTYYDVGGKKTSNLCFVLNNPFFKVCCL